MDVVIASKFQRSAILLSAVILLSSCSLPDLQPFATATAELSSAVTSSGEVVTAALEENQMPTEAKSFAEAFAVRTHAMAAFVEYSDSLASIAAAGKQGAENAGKVADAFNGLLVQVGSLIPLPGAGVISSGLVDVIKEASALVATVRAARSMKSAVEAADPTVQKLAQIVGADLNDMKIIVANAAENNEVRIKTCKPPHKPRGCQNLGTLGDVVNAYATHAESAEKNLARIVNAGRTPTAAQIKEAQDWRALAAEADERLAVGNALLENAKKEKRARLALLTNTEKAFKAWADLHAKLSANLKEGTQPNIRNLVTATRSLRGLIEKVQAL